MKMKMVTALFVLSLATASFAQTGGQTDQDSDMGEDSIRCLKKNHQVSVYTDMSKLIISTPIILWMSVFTEAPKLK